MFIVTLDYVVPLDQIDASLADHAGWLDQNYERGLFLASGRREPRVGGVILASGSRAEVEEAIAEDPFAVRGLARHTIVEFSPTKVGGPFDTEGIRGALVARAPGDAAAELPEAAVALGVVPHIDPAAEAERRVAFLADYLAGSGAAGYVIGVSGGLDSLVAGRLAQQACRRTGKRLIAMRLPYGEQSDESDAREAVAFIEPDEAITTDISGAVDLMHAATTPAGGYDDPGEADFVKGNIKARQRMVAQYAVAGRTGALVVGTDQAAEALMGFFTKHGDGACDVAPLSGLTKRQVRAVGTHLGAPAHLVGKTPTADLEELRPQLPDETAYGVSYDQIDDYLEGKRVDPAARSIIEEAYRRTAHKRALPAAPPPR